MRLEAAGHPTVLVATASFAALARQAAEAYGFPDARRIAVVEHPLGGISEPEVTGRAERAVDAVLELLTGER